MRRLLVAGNWKMNHGPAAAAALARALADGLAAARGTAAVDVLICPPFVSLAAARAALADAPLALGAQNCANEAGGAHTGEVSAGMLAEAGCAWVIVGHSERRQNQREGDDDFVWKITRAHAAGLGAIFCFGELLAERRAGRAEEVVRSQLRGVLPRLSGVTAANLVLAYEPVWAIGTGETATPEIAQQMHAATRRLAAEILGHGTATALRILYGGSVKAANARALCAQPDIDGGLVGGASLEAKEFLGIVRGAAQAG